MRSCSLFTLGTPDERSWPGVTDLPDYKKRFPKWVKNTLTTVVPRLADCQGDQGHDLLKVSSLLSLTLYTVADICKNPTLYFRIQGVGDTRGQRPRWPAKQAAGEGRRSALPLVENF